MAYLKLTTSVGVTADRAAAMVKDPVLLDHWFDGVAVETSGEDRTRWTVTDGDRLAEFEVHRIPTGDKRLVRWLALSGAHHCGAIRVHADGPRASKVAVEIAWDGQHARLLRKWIKAALRDFRYEAERLPESA